MKNILAQLALAACLISTGATAASSLDLVDASKKQYQTDSFASGMTGFKTELSFVYGVLSATGPGSVTYSYLGSNAAKTDSFLASNGSSFWNRGSGSHSATTLGSSFTHEVGSGILGFSFSSQNPAYTVTDAQNLQANKHGGDGYQNQGVFGIVTGLEVASKAYQYVLIYNDPVRNGDRDYNDLVVGVNFTPAVPEPETYAMLIAGLGLMATIARRRKSKPA